jgi:phage-related protein
MSLTRKEIVMADGSVTIDTKLNNDGFKSGLGKLGSIAKTGLKTVAVATGVVASAFAGIVTASVNARGEIEQSLGGVETLFKDSADKVIKNANNAFKTAGMSANEYMQNVTSFSASLLQSVAGDTNKAADIADMAMTDMSDNANKMGTSMEAITDAYQGFAKQNYTMLDNLKLGYGGTKTEMERLLADAQKITGIKYDINNLSDVYEAIHVIQGELGITGTTAKEASETLQGSFSAMKASWNNFLSGAGDLSQVVDTATDVVKNVVRIVNEAIPDIVSSISKSLPELLELGGEILQQLIQGIITYLPELMNSAGQILSSLAQGIIQTLPQLLPVVLQIIQTLITNLTNSLPQIIQVGFQVILQLATGIAQMLPTLIPEAVNCIVTLVEGLLDNIDQLIDAGIQLIIGLAEGLINALPTLIEKIPVIIEKLINAIVRNLPKIVEAGIKLIVMLAKGLIQAIPQLLSKIPEIIGAIVKGLGEGVSKVAEVGKNIIQGLWNGISNMRKLDS